MRNRVLIADNDHLLRAAVQEGLESAGYQVSGAADGQEAWQKIQDESPDYLVLHPVMPKLDGVRLCGYLKADPRFRSLPIFVLTDTAPESARELEGLEAEAYIAERSAGETVVSLLRAFYAFEQGERPSAAGERVQSPDETLARKNALEFLAETAHLTAALQNLGEGVLLLDRAGRGLYANPAGVDILQRSERELLGVELATFLDGPAGDSLRQALQALASQGTGASLRLDASCHDRTLQLIVTNLLGKGHVVGYLLLIRDLTLFHRRNRELTTLNELAALFTSPLHLDEVLQGVMERVCACMRVEAGWLLLKDPETDTLAVRFAVGRHKEAVEGRRFKVDEGIAGQVFREGVPAIVLDAQKDPRFRSGMDAAFGFTPRFVLYAPLRARNSILGVLQVVNSPASRPLGEEDLSLLGAIAAQVAMAIEYSRPSETIRQHAAGLEARVQERTHELEAANEQLRDLSRHKSEFLTTLSHELREPLHYIIGFSDLLLMEGYDPLTDRQARFLGHIQKSSKHLLQLINDILDLRKIEAGMMDLRPEALPVAQTVEEILTVHRELANKKAQDFRADIPPNLPPLTADPIRFKQILVNLLGNAMKFTPEQGRIVLTARQVPACAEGSETDGGAERAEDSEPGPWLEIRVADTGAGIKAADLPRLFQPFVQLGTVAAGRHEGSGLGLAITKRLVELHGGRILAQSEGEGCGSTFTVLLPLGGPGAPV
jgi:signal transduction histidine kinase/DNA-binding response OmpR family regulator